MNLSNIRGNEYVKRAYEIAASGHHSLIHVGLPGSGKSVLANEFYEMAAKQEPLTRVYLYEDTFPTLWSLNNHRQEKGMIWVSTRPCLCGYYSHPERECLCSLEKLKEHRGALVSTSEMMDITVNSAQATRMAWESLIAMRPGESSERVSERISKARTRQIERQGYPNNQLTADQVYELYEALDSTCKHLLKAAYSQLQLLPTQFFSSIRVARTIADMAGRDYIEVVHLAEAIQYRPSRDTVMYRDEQEEFKLLIEKFIEKVDKQSEFKALIEEFIEKVDEQSEHVKQLLTFLEAKEDL